MSKALGVDFGDRRTGIAISDASRTIAFPRETLVCDHPEQAAAAVARLAAAEDVAGTAILANEGERCGGIVASARIGDPQFALHPPAEIGRIMMLMPRNWHRLKRCDLVREGAQKADRILVGEHAADDVEWRPVGERLCQRSARVGVMAAIEP